MRIILISNLLVWCGWCGTQTTDSMEDPASDSGDKILHPFFRGWECYRRFWSHHPSVWLTQSERDTWLDYRWSLVLGPDWIFIFLHLRWLKQIYIQGTEGMMEKESKIHLWIHSTNLGWYWPICSVIFLGLVGQGIIGFSHWTRKNISRKHHCWGNSAHIKTIKMFLN